MKALDRGVEELKSYIDGLYEGKPALLREPRDKLIEEYLRRRVSLEKDADELLKTDLRTITDEDTREDLSEVAYSVAEGILLYKQMLVVLRTPAQYARLKTFYQSELDALAKAAVKPRAKPPAKQP